ncbi:MAG TPA: choloylglycine hydrolase family protein [Leptolyngbyaceae cyanobacterium M33_DOE_097]|uniref:Choloylglycine hydrolase family protein n=1 Tax=Oscillatoriales cyanobacterium SpSt-418 TaxID=2282169 RepID=A0A7C3PFR4_9CYAN|nr:choloylglycine hydrolase family protein [Leptolyngbyaceae cyanobacterium M33_DOE_097]
MFGQQTLKQIFATALLSLFLASSMIFPAQACTGIRLKAMDGTIVHARTLEFGIDLESDVIMVPQRYARTGTTPDGKAGLKWNTKYASLGANAVGLPFIFDGLNEKGLAVGTFYFPTTAEYMSYSPSESSQTIAPWEVGSWILENFATVEEVKANIGKIVVPEVVFKAWGFAPPVHYVVHDPSGKSIVIEYVKGSLNIHDNPLGVMSNSPAFDWHMTNLRNYVNFSLANVPPVQLESVKLLPLGQGSGMLGMPGDFTPPSRFVRAVAFSQSVLPSKTGADAILQAFHILNNFDIPKGAAREAEKDEHGNIVADYTSWISANDLKAKRFYFRTYENSQIRMVDLTKMNLKAKDIQKISMKGDEVIKPLN